VNAWWRVVVVVALFTCLGMAATPSPGHREQTPTVTSPVTVTTTPAAQVVLSGTTLSPHKAIKPVIPPSQPSRLDIGGQYPIHATVLPYDGSVLEPPGGNYRDVFLWTRRGLPGDGATDTTYLMGHTFSGPIDGVFDSLQKEPDGTRLQLTTSATLDYCKVGATYRNPKSKLTQDPRVWVVAPLNERGQYVVLIACLLSGDGRLQTGDNVVAVFRRC
jgi:hypothetical protein